MPWKWPICKKISVKSKFFGFKQYFLVIFLPVALIFMLILDIELLITFPLTSPDMIFPLIFYLILLLVTYGYVNFNIQFFYLLKWFRGKDLRVRLADCLKELSSIVSESTEGKFLGDYQRAIVFLIDEIIKKHVKPWDNIHSTKMIMGYKRVLSEELPFLLVFKNGDLDKKINQMQRELRKICPLNNIYPYVSYIRKSFNEFENKDKVIDKSISIPRFKKLLLFLNDNYQAIYIIITILSAIFYFILIPYFGETIQLPQILKKINELFIFSNSTSKVT